MRKYPESATIASSSKIQFEDSEESDESSSSGEEEAEIENELADIPFEELQKVRSDGTLAVHLKNDSEKKLKRANKNRPVEMSSKKPVSRFREVVQVPKKVVRDPRFESLTGDLDIEGFKKRYKFMFEETLPAEKAELQKLLRSSKDPEVIKDLKNRISWIEKQLKSESAKAEIRKQRLVEKYNDLKASGKLDSYIEKRRRRNAAKDHRFMPYRRANNEE